MMRISLDKISAAQLLSAKGLVQVCDQDGQMIGFFQPVSKDDSSPNPEIPYTPEELDRFARERGGRGLAEILADLEKRA